MSTARLIRIGFLLLIALVAFEADVLAEEPPGFGVNKGDKIENGFAFWKGTYLEPPYVISRRGLALYINNVKLEKAPEWPPYDHRVTRDPGMPNVTEKSTWEDINDSKDSRNAHWRKKLVYLHHKYDEQKAKSLMIKYFENLPFVKSVEPHPRHPDAVIITELSGRQQPVGIGKVTVGPPPTKEEMIASVDKKKTHLEKRLKAGDCYFFFGGSSYVTFGKGKAAKVLPDAVQVLKSALPIAEKRKKLAELEVLPPESKAFDEIITTFKGSALLDKKISELQQEVK